jgi:hypothetical protein
MPTPVKNKKKTLIPPTLVPSPGGKGGGLHFRHVKVYRVTYTPEKQKYQKSRKEEQ